MEEPKSKHRIQSAAHHIALECISPQSAHGSPYHVHPYPSPVRLQHAFQAQGSSNMFHPKGLRPHVDPRAHDTAHNSPILGRALCLTPKGSPVPGRVSHLSEKFHDSLTLNSDTDALVAKISAMFPTVSETHIKILLKKYYNREAVVISALQVEKHPITTPGPLTMSPSVARLQKGAVGVYSALQLAKGGPSSVHGSSHFTPMTGTPHGSPSLYHPASGASSSYGIKSVDFIPARQQSPKMKLKYLKNMFPKAEETIILDVLANKDNNVQKASEELIGMGFIKKESLVTTKKKDNQTPQPVKKVVIMRTPAEKDELIINFQKKYSSVPERIVSLALESMNFNEERADRLLRAVLREDLAPKSAFEVIENRRQPPVEVQKGWMEKNLMFASGTKRPILKTNGGTEIRYISQNAIHSNGPNESLRHGPRDNLLLQDYMPWTGPNPDFRVGQAVKPDGPEALARIYSASRGPGLAKGPAGLAKGSVYQKMNKKSAKIIR